MAVRVIFIKVSIKSVVYLFAGNNPIRFIDNEGLAKGDPPLFIGTTRAIVIKQTEVEIITNIESRASKIQGVPVDYVVALAKEEALTTKMYDVDNTASVMKTAAGRGGNATIGFGHLVHYGAIDSYQYDAGACEKEIKFKNGISIAEAYDLLAEDVRVRIKAVNAIAKKEGADIDHRL